MLELFNVILNFYFLVFINFILIQKLFTKILQRKKNIMLDEGTLTHYSFHSLLIVHF